MAQAACEVAVAARWVVAPKPHQVVLAAHQAAETKAAHGLAEIEVASHVAVA